MGTQIDRRAIERVLRPAATIDLMIFIMVALIGLLVGWRALDPYGKALEFVGVVTTLAGGASLFMGPTSAGSWTYQPPKGLDTGAHIARVFYSVPRGIGCSFMLIGAGFGALVPGLLLQVIG